MRTLQEAIDIAAPKPVVWGVLNDFGGVALWAPFLKDSSLVGELERGVGSYRVLRHFWGFRLEEAVIDWEDHSGYTFEVRVVPYPITNCRESWSVQAGNPHVTVTSRVYYDVSLGWLGRLLDWAFVRHLIRHEMRTGLQGLRDFVESRQPA